MTLDISTHLSLAHYSWTFTGVTQLSHFLPNCMVSGLANNCTNSREMLLSLWSPVTPWLLHSPVYPLILSPERSTLMRHDWITQFMEYFHLKMQLRAGELTPCAKALDWRGACQPELQSRITQGGDKNRLPQAHWPTCLHTYSPMSTHIHTKKIILFNIIKLDTIQSTCNPSTWEVERQEETEAQGHPWLCSEVKASLCYLDPWQKYFLR